MLRNATCTQLPLSIVSNIFFKILKWCLVFIFCVTTVAVNWLSVNNFFAVTNDGHITFAQNLRDTRKKTKEVPPIALLDFHWNYLYNSSGDVTHTQVTTTYMSIHNKNLHLASRPCVHNRRKKLNQWRNEPVIHKRWPQELVVSVIWKLDFNSIFWETYIIFQFLLNV